MTNIRFWIGGAALALLVLFAAGCRRCDDPANPDCRNYDPCFERGAVSAEFTMLENRWTGFAEPLVVYNTIRESNTLILQAKQTGLDRYEWQIGNEAEPRTGERVAVTFGGGYDSIRIRLRVFGEPKLVCDPEDDGLDSVVRYVHVATKENLPVLGKWKGYNTHEPDVEFVVEIRNRLDPPRMTYLYENPDTTIIGQTYAFMMNLPNQSPYPDVFTHFIKDKERLYTYYPLSILTGGEGFYFPGSYIGWKSAAPRGIGRLSKDKNTLTIQYTQIDTALYERPEIRPVPRTDTLTFIGTKQ